MADTAHYLTDKELEKMERHLSAIYARAEKELQEKVDAYFKRFEELDAKKRALVDDGKLTEGEYARWRQNKIMTGKHWTAMKEQAAQELLQANRTAQEYINGRLPSVYSLNYNSMGEAIEGAVSGYSFELVDAPTVKNLATSDKTLLPYKYVDGKKDVRWNTQKVNSEVLQGIVQGESIPNIAKRLQNVTEMNRASAIRNARTTVTSAENKGRMDSLHRAAEKGVITRKVWMAAIDARTREAHRLLDGQEQEIDDPFKSIDGDIMFPGDPDARPEMVYNCRCTLTYKVVGFRRGD
jgi:SPP1 gp7 family putative phage head morphogenesis protein